MTRYSRWLPMSTLPDYDGYYEVQVDGEVLEAEYVTGAWSNANATRWRGRRTKLRKSEVAVLKQALRKRTRSPAHCREAADAALQLARAAQERVARTGKRAALKAACRHFQIAVSLDASLQARDEKFLRDWWARFKPEQRAKVEAEVRTFLDGRRA